MAHFKNSFALLDDEEGDDVATLVDRIVNKVDDSLFHAQNVKGSSEFVPDESVPRRGGQGRRGGRRRNGYDGIDDVQGGFVRNKFGRNYSRDSYGGGDVNKDYGHWFGDDAWDYVNKAAGDDKYDHTFGRYRDGNWSYNGERGGDEYRVQDNHTADGQRRYRSGNQGHGNRRGDADQTQNYDACYGNGNENRTNDGERIGNGDRIQDNDGADRQRRYRNRNQSYDSKRGSYGDQTPNNVAVDGLGKYRNENWSFDGERRGTEYRAQNNDAGYGQSIHRNGRQSYGGERKYYENRVQDNVNEDEERTHRSGNRNYDGGRRGYGGYRGKVRQDYQRTETGELEETGNGEYGRKGRQDYWRISSGEVERTGNAAGGLHVKAECVNNYGSDAALVLEKAVEVEVYGDINFPKEADSQKKQEESELKKKPFEESQQKKEEEDMEAKLMTLDEYEKLLFEKRQSLESRKTRERIVAIDKDLEGMRLVKKQDVPDDKLRSEEKLQKKGSIEKKEKGHKLVHEFFKPAFRRRSNGSGGHGLGDKGGLNDQTHYNGPRTNGNASRARTQHRGLLAVPTDKDFPVLCATAAASAVKG